MAIEEKSLEDNETITAPRSFNEIISLWFKVHQMTEDFFAGEAPRASSSNTLLGALIYSVACAILSVISSQIYSPLSGDETTISPVFMFFILLIVLFVGFYVQCGVIYIAASVLGGKGDFTTQAYLQILYWAPIGLITSMASFIPTGSRIVRPLVVVFTFILNYRCIKAVHKMNPGRTAI